MAETLSTSERQDLVEIMGDWLGTNDLHDIDGYLEADELAAFAAQYNRIARIYYVFTGKDFLCGHGFVSSYGKEGQTQVNLVEETP